MGFMDELKKLTQPYDDEEDFFEGADPSFKPQPKAKAEPKIKNPISAAQLAFENSFGDSGAVSPAEEASAPKAAQEGGLFGGNGNGCGCNNNCGCGCNNSCGCGCDNGCGC